MRRLILYREENRILAMRQRLESRSPKYEAAHIIETAQAQVDHCQEEVDRLKAQRA